MKVHRQVNQSFNNLKTDTDHGYQRFKKSESMKISSEEIKGENNRDNYPIPEQVKSFIIRENDCRELNLFVEPEYVDVNLPSLINF